MKNHIKKYLMVLLKSAVSIGLLLYLFSLVDLQEVAERFGNADFYWLSIHVFLAFVAIIISSWKWWMLCRGLDLPVSFSHAMRLYFIGIFYNHFLPTSVGGDIVRGYGLSRRGCSGSEAYASIFAERYTGLATLVVFVLMTLPLDQRFIGDSRIQILTIVMTLGFIAGSWMVFSPSLLQSIEKNFNGTFLTKVFVKIKNFQLALRTYHNQKKVLAISFFASFLFYLDSIFIVYSGLKTFGIELPIFQLVTAVPVMLMLFLLPVSLGGIGLQEWAHTFVISAIGVPVTIGVSLGLLFRARSVFFGLLGGVMVFFSESNESKNRCQIPHNS